MEILRTATDLRQLDKWRSEDNWRSEQPLVLVPTMGALHPGHLSLVEAGAALGPVVVSIFVNPTQFGPGEDLDAYPRDLESDLAMLEPLGVKAVFAPSVTEMYGQPGEVTVQPGNRGQGLCGGDRPGHFSGVLTVVAKLLGLVRPDVAIFGRKDAQQCLVIRQMVEDLKIPVWLADGPTVREADGLAMSSRNRYLSEEQRLQALCLSRALHSAREMLVAGERNREKLQAALLAELSDADKMEYAEVRLVPDLEEPVAVSGTVLLAVAARVGPARLIDNLVLDLSSGGVKDGFLLGDPQRWSGK